MGITSVPAYICDRCKHVWLPRIKTNEPPIICPKCKSYYWNKSTRQETANTEARDRLAKHILELLIQRPRKSEEITYRLQQFGHVAPFATNKILDQLARSQLISSKSKTNEFEITQEGRKKYVELKKRNILKKVS